MKFSKIDEKNMKEAIKLAEKAYLLNEVPIGCIVVDENNKIIGKGFNKTIKSNSYTSHAEMEALQMAAFNLQNWRLSNCTLYVTLEPCMMCTGAIFGSRLKKLIYSVENKKFGNIESIQDINNVKLNHKLIVEKGLLKSESLELLKKFFENIRKDV